MEGFELVDGKFITLVADEAGLDTPYVLGPIFDNGQTAWQLLEAARPFVFRSSSYSARGYCVAMLRKMVMYMRAKGTFNFPQTAEEWQTVIVDIYQYHLKEQPGKSRFTTRMEEWQNGIKLLLKHLRDVAHLIPEHVSIPPKQRFRQAQRSHFTHETVASGKTKKVEAENEVYDTSCLLVNLDISQTNAEYLENFRDRLIAVRATLEEDCVEYVKSMAAHFEFGERLLKVCTEAQAIELKAEYHPTHFTAYWEMRKRCEDGTKPGETEISLARILRLFLIEEHYEASIARSFESSTWLPFVVDIRFPPSAPPPPFPTFGYKTRRLRWMLGLLDVTDICIAHLLLLLRNPSFNALPLFDAKLKDKSGNSYFTFVLRGKALSVDKRRAHSRKQSALDGDSILAINTVLQMTQKQRDKMPESDPLKNRLFFIINHFGPTAIRYHALYNFNKGPAGRGLQNFLPRTAATGIPGQHVVPKRIRRTHAVLEWFKTGSVLKAARLIGNTTKVTIKHYIPEALLEAWNIRLIRRFQNLLLAAASAKESYHLSATDFSSLAELRKFIEDMLREHSPESSKFASEIHQRFRYPEQFEPLDNREATSNSSSLVVGINAMNLSVLYAFRDIAYQKGLSSFSGTTDESHQVKPQAVVDLADLLTTRLPDHHDLEIRGAHVEAERLARTMVDDFHAGAFATFRAQE